jgi:tetratricopeptide (TPR) repeat protein
MDRHFLEFWGNFLLQAAQGQKQLEELAKWTSRGFLNFEDLTALFRKSYGLEQLNQDSPDYLQIWEKAQKDFRDSFRDYLSLLGVVPRDEYLELAEKYEELKEKAAEQEETIKLLRLVLSEKGLDFTAGTLEFQRLLEKQGDQFHELMKGVSKALKPDRHQD